MADEADDSQSKNEEPTQKRLDKASEEGQVLRSQDFSVAVTLFGFSALIFLISVMAIEVFNRLFRFNFVLDSSVTRNEGLMIGNIFESVRIVLPLLGMIFSLAIVGVILGNSFFGGIGFSLKSASPKFSKLNPLNGIKRMFGTTALFELTKNMFKTIFIGFAIALVIYYYLTDLGALSVIPVRQALNNAGGILVNSMVVITLVLFLIAMIDMPWQYFQHMKKLRMSRQDIKDEMKESDGNPEIKAKLRQRQREIAFNKMMAAIETADVIITNPTHFAVALSYTPGGSDAPKVVAKGVDFIAQKIREKAKEHQVPLFEAPELARAIYFSTKLEDMIPEDLYHTVAEVIAYIFNIDTAMRMGRPLKRPRPSVPPSMRFDENGIPIEEDN